jgi:biotin operon repressor
MEPKSKLSFALIREDVLSSKQLNSTDKAVWCGLMMFWMQKECCWPTQETLANATGMSRKAVCQAIHRLVKEGYVEAKRRRYTTIYTKGKAYKDGDSEPEDVPQMLPSVTSKGSPDVTISNISTAQMLPLVTSDVTIGNIEVYQEVDHKDEVEHKACGANGALDADAPPPAKNSINGKKKHAYEDSPHLDQLQQILTWFQEHKPTSPKNNQTQSLDALYSMVKTLKRDDGLSEEQAVGHVQNLIQWGVQDVQEEGRWRGWGPLMLSIPPLTKAKTPGDVPKWRKIEVDMKRSQSRRRQQQSSLDELEAANARWEAAKRKAGLA